MNNNHDSTEVARDALLHELHVHQIELEMQNETLRKTQVELEESRDRYRDLYDFAPVGYLSLNEQGMIVEINRTAAGILGAERGRLISRRFSQYLADDCLALYTQQGKRRFSCEQQIKAQLGDSRFVHLDCQCDESAKTMRIAISDITERKQAERTTQELSERMRHILNSTPAIHYACNYSEGVFVPSFVSANLKLILGYDADAFLGNAAWWWSGLHPEERDGVTRSLARAIEDAGCMHYTHEYRFKCSDGSYRWMHDNMQIIRNASGQCHEIVGSWLDITGRHHSEMLLRESEEKYHAIFEETPDGIVLVNAAGMIVDCNPEFMRQTCKNLEQLRNIHIWDLRPADQIDPAIEKFNELLDSGSEGAVELKFKQTGGNVIHVEFRSMAITIGGERYLQCISRDITERLRADTQLRESEEKMRVIFDSALDGILLLDVQSGKFSSANVALCRMLGYNAEELSRLGVEDIHLAADLPWVRADIEQHLRGQKQHSVNVPMKRRDGSVLHVDIRTSCVTLGGKVYLAGIVHDTSERLHRENELREYQQLLRELASQGAASREAELKHIAREVHDELGQLLTALRMDISLLRIQFGERDPVLMSKIQDMLVLVDKSIQGARDVTTNLRPPALDMGLVPAIEWLCSEVSGRTSIACDLHVERDPPALDDVRTLTLFRIVQESLTNVVRHAQAEHVDITFTGCGDDIAIEIRDDGQGFEPKMISANRSFGLMGMKERALAIHGEVSITSSSGRGTVVSIRIPLSQKNPGRRSND